MTQVKKQAPSVYYPSKATAPDNRHEIISSRLAAIMTHIWELNDQEKSYLDKHFLLVRTFDELLEHHADNHTIGRTLLNGGISYAVVLNSIDSLQDLQTTDRIVCSFRFQRKTGFAVVIIRRYKS